MIKKRNVHQITPLCCCERVITTVLSECHYKQSVFKQLSSVSFSRSAKRRHSCTRRTFSDAEYPEVTANMVGPSTTPSKTKGKQPTVSSDEFDTEPEGVYQHTRTRTGIVAQLDYSALAWGISSEMHSAIAESQASNPFIEKEAFTYMAGTPEDMARRFEQQAQAQREQFDMICNAPIPRIRRRHCNVYT